VVDGTMLPAAVQPGSVCQMKWPKLIPTAAKLDAALDTVTTTAAGVMSAA
jgi:hypothetical protein